MMNARTLILGIGHVICISLVVESKTVNRTGPEKTVHLGKNVRPKSGLAYSYPTPILMQNHDRRQLYFESDRQKGSYYENHPIFAFGLENFVSYAAHFCKYETHNGAFEVVSVGSGNGTIENDIIAAYANLFGEELNITLVDPKPACPVDFPTVEDLLAKRANAVRNCVLLIIYPFEEYHNDGYDIGAIRKLQPRAVLTMYEIAGVSGSLEFLACLHPPGYRYAQGKKCSQKLDNYVIEEIAYQEVWWDSRLVEWRNSTRGTLLEQVVYKFRLVKLERIN